MKKIITICLVLIGLNQMKGAVVPEFRKSGGGLFGYKFVTTTIWENKIIVACASPGFTKCKMAAAIVMPDGPDLTPETVENIDRAITAVLTPENTSGSLMFGETFYVTYSYDVDRDDLIYKVYSLGMARERGFIQ